MELTTEQTEAEAAKAAVTDTAAMDQLMKETLDVTPPQEPPGEPPAPPAEPEKREEPPKEPPKEPPAEPPAEPPTEPAAAKAPEPDEFERNLDSPKYELPAGATRQSREINKAVKQTARDEHGLRRIAETARLEADRKVQELERQLATAAQDRAELERLRPIVETFAIERDPRLNERFGNELGKINERIAVSLLNRGLEKETIDYIMQHGGPARFSRDSVSQVEAAPEQAGGKPVQMSHKQFWEERVMNQLSDDEKRPIKLAFDDELRLNEWRDAELRSKLSNRQQYFKDLEEQSKRQEESFKAECKKQLEIQMKDLGDLAIEKTIPADATPAQKERLETFNKAVQDAKAKFDTEFLNTTPEALIGKTLGRLLLPNVKMLLAMKDAEIAEMRDQRDAIQKKWDASLKAANTSHRQSVQQPPKPLEGVFEKHDGRRMEQMMETLPA